jgi:hypothetical protein
MNDCLKSHLEGILSAEQIGQVLKPAGAIRTLPPSFLKNVLTILMDGCNLQMKVMIGLSAIQIPVGLLLWRKKQLVV